MTMRYPHLLRSITVIVILLVFFVFEMRLRSRDSMVDDEFAEGVQEGDWDAEEEVEEIMLDNDTTLVKEDNSSIEAAVSSSNSTNSTRNTTGLVCDATGEFCAPPLPGKWVPRTTTFHAPVCCSWDHVVFDDLVDQCGSHRWPQNNNDTASVSRYQGPSPKEFPAQTGGHACTCRGNWTDEYIWSSPDLIAFNGKKTCTLLGNRRVLVVGDSVSQQFASSIMNALQPFGCAPRINLALADTLVMRNHKDRGHHWFEEFQRLDQPEIVIWNVGPHIYGEDNFRSIVDEVATNMTSIQTDQKAQGKTVTQFVFKTQQPGGCSKESLIHLRADEAAQEMNRLNNTEPYNYRVYYDRDLYALDIMANRYHMPMIDLRMLYARPEAHVDARTALDKHQRDCLHLCFPGPLDVAADLFQNLLLQLYQQ